MNSENLEKKKQLCKLIALQISVLEFNANEKTIEKLKERIELLKLQFKLNKLFPHFLFFNFNKFDIKKYCSEAFHFTIYLRNLKDLFPDCPMELGVECFHRNSRLIDCNSCSSLNGEGCEFVNSYTNERERLYYTLMRIIPKSWKVAIEERQAEIRNKAFLYSKG
jgi:hypothetical protein